MTPLQLFLMGMDANSHRYIDLGHGKLKGCCPAHDDRTPSMAISEASDGRLLVHCYAGCTASEIVSSIGLELHQLFPETDKNVRSLFPSRKSKTPTEDEFLLEICASSRRAGKRLTAQEKQLEQQAFMRRQGA